MIFIKFKLTFLVALLIPCVCAAEYPANTKIINELRSIEARTEGRLGVFAVNTENGNIIGYREDEIFPTGCTSKVVGVGAVLKKNTLDPFLLNKVIKYSKEDIDFGGYSPITGKTLEMSVKKLCSSAISYSDNTAMNILLNLIGGVNGMNEFASSIGEHSFRQDNDWPKEAFSGGKGNLSDTSTPKSMVTILRELLEGDTLGVIEKELLNEWLEETKTGKLRIRAGAPIGWRIGNKTGTGARYGTTNDLAILRPIKHSPIYIGIYYTSDERDSPKREDIISTSAKIILDELIKNDPSLEGI